MSSSSLVMNNSNCFMSWNEFVNCCNKFVETSNRLNDGWSFNNYNGAKAVGESYLVKKIVKCYSNGETVNEQQDLYCDNLNLCESDAVVCDMETISWEYHILYSPSYGVPCLYFNAWKRDGSILPIDEINRLSGDFNIANKVCVVSQQEHPIIHRPFYYVHPCDSMNILKSCKSIVSSQLMDDSCGKLIKSDNVNPLLMWLSTIASVVHIDLNPEYANSFVK